VPEAESIPRHGHQPASHGGPRVIAPVASPSFLNLRSPTKARSGTSNIESASRAPKTLRVGVGEGRWKGRIEARSLGPAAVGYVKAFVLALRMSCGKGNGVNPIEW
jgi:hypothetical protein